MNWKQFLKPDKRKIVIWIIIFLIIPIPNLILMYIPHGPYFCKSIVNGTEVNSSCPADVSRPNEIGVPNLIFLIICLIVSPPDSSNSIAIEETPLITIIFLISSYILSCIIFWIYDNFRKKNKK